MAGNGGQMAEQFEAKVERAGKKPKLAQVKRTIKTNAETKAVTPVSTGVKTGRGGIGNAAAVTLRKAACRVVKANRKTLSDLLLDEAYKGSKDSRKLLISLAAPAKTGKDKGKKRCRRSLAMDLASGPVWQETATESDAETEG
jgi:hypothetical protein